MKFQTDSQLSTRYQQFKLIGQTCENVFFWKFSDAAKIVNKNEGAQFHNANPVL